MAFLGEITVFIQDFAVFDFEMASYTLVGFVRSVWLVAEEVFGNLPALHYHDQLYHLSRSPMSRMRTPCCRCNFPPGLLPPTYYQKAA